MIDRVVTVYSRVLGIPLRRGRCEAAAAAFGPSPHFWREKTIPTVWFVGRQDKTKSQRYNSLIRGIC
jgi:hypothetical protein